MEWRNHLPNDCPPPDAEPANGDFYRLIKEEHTQPQLEDFLSKREENPREELLKGITECQFCGLSVLKSIEDVCKLQKRVPGIRKDVAGIGTLTPNLGRIKHTPTKTRPSHYTWWISKESKPWEFFQLVDTVMVQS